MNMWQRVGQWHVVLETEIMVGMIGLIGMGSARIHIINLKHMIIQVAAV